jgi:tetratricopeptide (TPR) repeat protein
MHVSEGTINTVIQDLLRNVDILELQRQVAITSKKTGIPIVNLVSNMAFANAIKLRAFADNKIESVLVAINSSFANGGNLDADTVSAIFVELCDLVSKNNISPNELLKELRSKYDELPRLSLQVQDEKTKLEQIKEKTRSELERYNTTLKELEDYSNCKEDFRAAGLDIDKREEALNVLYNLGEMDTDPEKIMAQLKQIRFLDVHRVELMDDCSKIEKILEYYNIQLSNMKSTMRSYDSAVEIIKNLLQKGNSHENIVKAFDIYSRDPNFPIVQFEHDCEVYGGLVGAIYKKYLDYIRLNSGAKDVTEIKIAFGMESK